MEGQVLGFVGVGRMGGPMASRLLDAARNAGAKPWAWQLEQGERLISNEPP